MLIERAWRDEGTSLHYLPPSEWSELQPRLRERLRDGLAPVHKRTFGGSSWTTDAPFRETPDAIATARRAGVVAVEMEAAALYAFATARQRSVVCVAHVTNAMAVDGQDFEKGHDNGVAASLAIIEAVAARCAVPKHERGRTGTGQPRRPQYLRQAGLHGTFSTSGSRAARSTPANTCAAATCWPAGERDPTFPVPDRPGGGTGDTPTSRSNAHLTAWARP